MSKQVQVGDRVAVTQNCLKLCTANADRYAKSKLRGVVVHITPGYPLATVHWDGFAAPDLNDEERPRIFAGNLCKPRSVAFTESPVSSGII